MMKKTKDRFDLEQDIHQCWYIVDDINMLMEYVLDNPKFTMPPETEDVLANKLLGLKELYEMRFDRLWNTFLESHNLPSANKENIE
mgnify:CR=1 FL=1